jgi:hypothetical protein
VTLTLRKVLFWTVLGLAVLYLLHSPQQAAALAHAAGSRLVDAGAAIVTFVSSLF